tara:strand:+ start:110 stop:1432 length:1323 start_codon:yes stop_codon:yes gene_type:complete
MDNNFKKKLNLVFDYLTINGCKSATKEGDYHNMSFHESNEVFYCNSKASPGNIRLPLSISKDLEILLDENQKDFDYFGDDPYNFELSIIPSERRIEFYEHWSDLIVGESSSMAVSADEDEDVKTIITEMCTIHEICRGDITYDFTGGGDSGYIDDTGRSAFDGNVSLGDDAEDLFLRLLNYNFSGWEINEGSQGDCVIDMDMETMTVNVEVNEDVAKSDLAWSYTSPDESSDLKEEMKKVIREPNPKFSDDDDIMLLSFKKVLDNLFFNGIDIDYTIRNIRDEYLDINFTIDINKTLTKSENYDQDYVNAIYNLEEIIDKAETYTGLKNKVKIYYGFDYINTDSLDFATTDVEKELKSKLISDYGFTEEKIEENNIWVDIYYSEENTPYVRLEIGISELDTDKMSEKSFEGLVYSILANDKYSILHELVDDDYVEFWINH